MVCVLLVIDEAVDGKLFYGCVVFFVALNFALVFGLIKFLNCSFYPVHGDRCVKGNRFRSLVFVGLLRPCQP